MEFVPWLNAWWKFEVGEVNNTTVWKVVVLFVIWSNWVIFADHFNDGSNGPIAQASRWKDVPVSQGNSCPNAQVCVAFTGFRVEM